MFVFASLLLIGCNNSGSNQTEKKEPKSVETTTTIQDETKQEQEQDMKEEASKTIRNSEKENYQAEYRLNKDNWSFEPIQDAEPKVVLLTFDDAPDNYSLEIAKTLQNFKCRRYFL
ncbi:hypothetical protein ACIGC1_03140 [Peribacillus butanolivorans]|uniref:hypothetical protein n=1 Tax=Peribacillus butanolivorans TaxID=421767 RepID=UPI0037C75388